MIQESFKKLSKNKITLMIAHRLSTVIDADKILVIDNRVADPDDKGIPPQDMRRLAEKVHAAEGVSATCRENKMRP